MYSWSPRYERGDLINVNRDIDKVQCLGHFEEKKMYTIWFTIEGDTECRSFTGPIESAREVYDHLAAAGVRMNCTRP